MVESNQSEYACQLQLEIEDEIQNTYEGTLSLAQSGFIFIIKETLEEFELSAESFIVFAKQKGEAIYC